ncbi:MAG: hypothetical protein KF713_13205 [Turneriella sp.]|nr:hypothetical protein [Turneriella sp.]
MNSLIGAALIGGVAGFVAFFIASRIFGPERKMLSQLVGFIMMSLFTAFGNSHILPLFKGRDIKAQLAPYLEDEMMRPLVEAIREFDPATYETFLDEMTKIALANPDGPQEKIDALCRAAGAKIFAKYYRTAADDALIGYLKNTVAIVRELSKVAPNHGMRLFFPDVFGSIQYGSLAQRDRDIMRRFLSPMRDLVKSSVLTPSKKEHSFGSYYLETYRTAYFKAHPDFLRQFSSLNTLRSEADQGAFLLQFALFLEGILNQPKAQAAEMQRFMGGSQ